MGIERPIPCHGVYPPNSNPKVCGVRDARQAGNNAIDNYVNYLSMRIQEEDAEIEVDRILGLCYAERVWRDHLKKFRGEKEGVPPNSLS